MVSILSGGVFGSNVKIVQKKRTILTLCEVEVYGFTIAGVKMLRLSLQLLFSKI